MEGILASCYLQIYLPGDAVCVNDASDIRADNRRKSPLADTSVARFRISGETGFDVDFAIFSELHVHDVVVVPDSCNGSNENRLPDVPPCHSTIHVPPDLMILIPVEDADGPKSIGLARIWGFVHGRAHPIHCREESRIFRAINSRLQGGAPLGHRVGAVRVHELVTSRTPVDCLRVHQSQFVSHTFPTKLDVRDGHAGRGTLSDGEGPGTPSDT
mmetsp:Transcript_70173/g.97579  ORF Transcript_70173/g.97579 Transcript_70173/m.97579 type:complete len:215 (+) Transcript_70173:697-1341(+)